MTRTLASICMLFALTHYAWSSAIVRTGPITTEACNTAIANPVKVAAIMRNLQPTEQADAADAILRHALAQEMSNAQKKQLVARLAAACIAAVAPDRRMAIANALVSAGGKENASIIVAAIALSAGTGEAGQALVDTAVEAAEVAGVKAEATAAAQSPDVILGTDLSVEVVQTTQEVHRASILTPPPVRAPTLAVDLDGEPEVQQPIAPPPTPPRPHPYEAQ